MIRARARSQRVGDLRLSLTALLSVLGQIETELQTEPRTKRTVRIVDEQMESRFPQIEYISIIPRAGLEEVAVQHLQRVRKAEVVLGKQPSEPVEFVVGHRAIFLHATGITGPPRPSSRACKRVAALTLG